jgi:predicted PurR-regulated permease PerM
MSRDRIFSKTKIFKKKVFNLLKQITNMSPSRRFSILAALLISLIFLLTVYLSRDFIFPLMMSVVLVFLLKPLFDLFFHLTGNRILSSALPIIAVMIIMLLVLLGMTQTMLSELSNIQAHGFQAYPAQNASQDIELLIRGNFEEPLLTILLDVHDTAFEIISARLSDTKAGIVAIISSIPLYFAQSIVVIFFTFFMLFQGEEFARRAMVIVPADMKDRVWLFFQELGLIYTNIFTAYVFTALLSGALAFSAFSLLKIPYPFVLAGVVIIFTLIPLVGAPWVFIPLALFYLLQGEYMLAVILAICGILIFVIPQYLILPRLAQSGGQIHPLITVLAFLGPLFALGLPGVIVGPILYGFLLAVYRTMVHEEIATEAAGKSVTKG